ncbi:hypothetical protein F2Q68_00031321 [Brassica cretica]|uniref:Uncharacterized protein n=1 Tax=Brassica cretica TaxID=69181 RepID=A0A8S9GJZ3_BRACR|nr:hypothetical protein F2Q68_00031321 [Brassica cretica]
MGELDCLFGPTRPFDELDDLFGPTRPFSQLDGLFGPTRRTGELDGVFGNRRVGQCVRERASWTVCSVQLAERASWTIKPYSGFVVWDSFVRVL